MKVKFKKDKTLERLKVGDIIKATRDDGNTYIYQIVEAWSDINQCALVNLYASDDCFTSGYLTINGRKTIDQDEFTRTIPELINNLEAHGFKNIKKANFTLVEE